MKRRRWASLIATFSISQMKGLPLGPVSHCRLLLPLQLWKLELEQNLSVTILSCELYSKHLSLDARSMIVKYVDNQ